MQPWVRSAIFVNLGMSGAVLGGWLTYKAVVDTPTSAAGLDHGLAVALCTPVGALVGCLVGLAAAWIACGGSRPNRMR